MNFLYIYFHGANKSCTNASHGAARRSCYSIDTGSNKTISQRILETDQFEWPTC